MAAWHGWTEFISCVILDVQQNLLPELDIHFWLYFVLNKRRTLILAERHRPTCLGY
jgi:hypothetical protein